MSGVTLLLNQTYDVLARMNLSGGSAIATHWMSIPAGFAGDTAKTRRLMVKMQSAGLVEGVEASRSGRVFWWKITEAGRQFLSTFADQRQVTATRNSGDEG